ncbi:hypothetical protein J6590_068396 [Homalodisca vitripennis]|nr:hypothetical protein J6590_068396 [Homalodisca vitripennis]
MGMRPGNTLPLYAGGGYVLLDQVYRISAQGRDIHQYGTRGRNNFWVQKHGTAAFTHLPS